MTVQSTAKALDDRLKGRVLQPGDPDYDSTRSVWNGMIDRRPKIIARCESSDDVIAAVKFAREHDLPVSIRGGGHSVAGRGVCDDGLMIDLSEMNNVTVDADRRIARVEGGATLADLDRATEPHGLVTTGGLVSKTGVAGLTLGGGIGYLARRFGLTIDNLKAVDLVTASGETVHASENDNPDLFWALRGGGGNFGVVTNFEFQLHEAGPEVQTAQIFYPYKDAANVLRAYRDLMADAPDELACYALVAHVPPAPPFPEEFHGVTSIALVACYTGDAETGLKLLSPLKELGDPIFDAIGPMNYTTLQQSFDAGMPDGGRYYWKGEFMKEITDKAIDTFVRVAEPLPGPLTLVGFEPLGGAISRVDSDKTAFPHRDVQFALGLWAGWTEPEDDEKIIAWTREFHKAMSPYGTGGVYMNYLDRDDADRAGAAYGSNYERLQKVKAKYDPDNFFRLNQNIKPR